MSVHAPTPLLKSSPKRGCDTDTRRPSLHYLSLQHHGQHLVVGLNRDGQGFALIESLFRDFETNDDGSSLFGSCQQLGFGRQRRRGTFFQSRKRLEIAIQIDGRSGVIVESLVVGGGKLRF